MADEQPSLDAIFSAPPSLDEIFTPKASKEDIGQGNALVEGIRAGGLYNFPDEISGLEAAAGKNPNEPRHYPMGVPIDALIGAGKVGYEALTGRGKATEEYEKAKKEDLEQLKTAREQYPKTTLAGDVTGSVVSPLPFGSLKAGAKLGEWAAQGVKMGATAGALSGIGEGEGAWDRAAKGVTSGALGAGVGGLLGTGLGAVVNKLAGKAATKIGEEGAAVSGGDDLVAKMTTALREAKPIRAEQEAIYHAERSRQAGELERIGKEVPGEAGFRAQLGSLKGELPKVDFESIRPHFTEENITSLFDRIQQHTELRPFDKIDAKEGLAKLLGHKGGGVPTKGELAHLEQVFGQDFVEAVIEKQPMMKRFMDTAGEAINIPRAIMASTDLSAPFRQGLPLGAAHPVLFGRAFKDMHKYAASENYHKDLYTRIQGMKSGVSGDDLYPIMKDSRLAMTHPDAPDFGGREERLFTNLPDSIPGFGKIFRGSNRGYTGMLTQLRTDVFKQLWEQMERNGTASPEAAAKLADYINTFSGRGQWSFKYGTQAAQSAADKAMFEKAMPLMNAVLFSPRLMASRGKLVTNLANPEFYKLPKEVRYDAYKAYAGMGGALATMFGIAKWAGADVEHDPRNADFGKIKVGNTRYEVSGGMLPYIRLISQLTTGKTINSQSGRVTTVNEGFKPLTRADILARFLESKEAPAMGLAHKFLKQQGFLGKEYSAQAEAIKSVTPLIIQDIWELNQEYGPKGAALALPGFYGAGSQTYGKVQFEEGKDKLGLPAAKIGSPPDWGEFASQNASRPWKSAFGEPDKSLGSTKNFDAIAFYRDNYSKMDRKEQQKFDAHLAKNYPDLDKKWGHVIRDERDLKVTPHEWDLRVKPLPERISAIKQELDALPTYEEKKKLWSRYATDGMGIITKNVHQQMNKLGYVPRIDPTNTIKLKDQKEIEKALESVPRRQSGGRIRGQSGGGPYTDEELEASRKEDRRFREFLGRVAPRGIPWQSWRRSQNVEDRSNESQVSEMERIGRLYPDRESRPPITNLSRQGGYDDIGRQDGGGVDGDPRYHFMRPISNMAPRGLPWRKFRQSKNIEWRDDAPLYFQNRWEGVNDTEFKEAEKPTDYGEPKARGGKIKRRIPTTVPETLQTLKKQQQALIRGNRSAMLFPHRNTELALPKGMRRMKTKGGLLHFDPKKLRPSQIKKADASGKMNEILEMGPVSKEEALARAAKGEMPMAVVERSPDGTEVKAAMGTETTAPEQIAALEASSMPENQVAVEPVPETILRRAMG